MEIEQVKAKYIGHEPMVREKGRRYDPGITYTFSLEDWTRIRPTGKFELVYKPRVGEAKIVKPKKRKKRTREIVKEIKPRPELRGEDQ